MKRKKANWKIWIKLSLGRFICQCFIIKRTRKHHNPISQLRNYHNPDMTLIGGTFFIKRVMLWGQGKLFFCAHAGLGVQLCLTLCNPMDCSPPGSSVLGFLSKITEVGNHFLLQGIFLTQRSKEEEISMVMEWGKEGKEDEKSMMIVVKAGTQGTK